MTNLMYEPENYKEQLRKLLITSNSTSLSYTNHIKRKPSGDDLEVQPSSNLQQRRPTPYHPRTSKSKLSTTCLPGHVLFRQNGDDSNESGSLVVEEVQEILPKPFSPSSCNKKGSFSSASNFIEPSSEWVKRQSTPYHTTNKKIKGTSGENHKSESFRFQDLEVKRESNDVVITPEVSESPKIKKRKKIENERNHTAPLNCQRNGIYDKVTPMEAVELNYDSDNYPAELSHDNSFFVQLESDLEHSSDDSNELDITSDFTNSIVYNDMSLTESDPIKTSSSLEVSDANIPEKSELEEDIIIGEDTKLIILPDKLKLYFHGLMSVTVVHGVVEVLGYTLTVNSGAVEVFSPRGSSFIYFETREKHRPVMIEKVLSEALSALNLTSKDAGEFCLKLLPGSSVILCKEIKETDMTYLEKHISQQIFPKSEHSMRCVFQSKIDNWNVFQVGPEWDMLINKIGSSSRTFICGGKGVGKSTMLRYTINKLLLAHPEILVIDLDPGQPEFTVSGCISATIIKEPVFGPNYTHLRNPCRCLFLPNINVSYQPAAYLASVEELLRSCADLPKIPTLINYMGFTKGLGLQIFCAIVAHTQPTDIIQIQSSSGQRNFRQRLSHKLICTRSKELASNVMSISTFSVFTIQSVTDMKQGWHLQPRQIREMCVLSYLSKMLRHGVLTLTDPGVRVFVISLTQMKIICNKQKIQPSIINANLVALCSLQEGYTSYTCHGWGVVQGINLVKNELFLLTPVSRDEIEQVDHLILGSVALPPSLYMTSDNNGLLPFVCPSILFILGQIPKRSHLAPMPKKC